MLALCRCRSLVPPAALALASRSPTSPAAAQPSLRASRLLDRSTGAFATRALVSKHTPDSPAAAAGPSTTTACSASGAMESHGKLVQVSPQSAFHFHLGFSNKTKSDAYCRE